MCIINLYLNVIEPVKSHRNLNCIHAHLYILSTGSMQAVCVFINYFVTYRQNMRSLTAKEQTINYFVTYRQNMGSLTAKEQTKFLEMK